MDGLKPGFGVSADGTHAATEAALQELGVPFTALRNDLDGLTPALNALGGDRHGRHRGDRLRAHSTQRAGRKSARDVDCGLSVAAANAEPWRWAPRTRHR